MIGDRRKSFTDSGGLGMKIEKDPAQIADIRNMILYTFSESTIEIDFVGTLEDEADFPFARIKQDKAGRDLKRQGV